MRLKSDFAIDTHYYWICNDSIVYFKVVFGILDL